MALGQLAAPARARAAASTTARMRPVSIGYSPAIRCSSTSRRAAFGSILRGGPTRSSANCSGSLLRAMRELVDETSAWRTRAECWPPSGTSRCAHAPPPPPARCAHAARRKACCRRHAGLERRWGPSRPCAKIEVIVGAAVRCSQASGRPSGLHGGFHAFDRDRVQVVVAQVVVARPHQLHGRARHGLGDERCFHHVSPAWTCGRSRRRSAAVAPSPARA
jgi:hypothetical protein